MPLHAAPSPSRTSKVSEAATPLWQSQRVRLPYFLNALGASPATQQQNTQEESNQHGFYLTAGTQQGNATPLPQHTRGSYFTGGDSQEQHHQPSTETATSPAAQQLQAFYEDQAVFDNLDAAVTNSLTATVADMFNLDDKDTAEDMVFVQPVKPCRVQDAPPAAGASRFQAVNRLRSFAEQASAGNTVPQNPGSVRLFKAMPLCSEDHAGEDQQAFAIAACPKTSALKEKAAEQTILDAAHKPQEALGKDDGDIQPRAREPNRTYMHGAAASGCQGAAMTLARVDNFNRQFVSDVQRRSAPVLPSSLIGPVATNIAAMSVFTTGLGRQLPPASPMAIKRVQAILQELDGTEPGNARSLKRLADEATFRVPPAKRLAASAAPAVNTGNAIAALLTTASGKALAPASPAAMRRAQAILNAVGKPDGVDHALNGKPSNSGQQVAGQPGRAPIVCLQHADQAVTSAAPPTATSMLTTDGGRQLPAASPAAVHCAQAVLQVVNDSCVDSRLHKQATNTDMPPLDIGKSAQKTDSGRDLPKDKWSFSLLQPASGRVRELASPTAMVHVQASLRNGVNDRDGTSDVQQIGNLETHTLSGPDAQVAQPAVTTREGVSMFTTGLGRQLPPASPTAMRRAQAVLGASEDVGPAEKLTSHKRLADQGVFCVPPCKRTASAIRINGNDSLTFDFNANDKLPMTEPTFSLPKTASGRALAPVRPTALRHMQALLDNASASEAATHSSRTPDAVIRSDSWQRAHADAPDEQCTTMLPVANRAGPPPMFMTASGKQQAPPTAEALQRISALLGDASVTMSVDQALETANILHAQHEESRGDAELQSRTPAPKLLLANGTESPETLQKQHLSTAKAYKAEPIRSTVIVSALEGRPRRRFITPTSALRLQTLRPSEPDDSSIVAADHAGQMPKPVRWTLHDMYAGRAKRIPLVEFFGHAPQDSTLACCDDKQIHLPAGCPLMNRKVKDSSGLLLGSADFREMLIAAGADKNAASEHWVQNHFQWVVWKLASYEQSFPQYQELCLTPSRVLDQLKYRYEREVHQGQRSVLAKVMEKDFPAAAPMVLCVSNSTDLGSLDSRLTGINARDDHASAVRGTKPPEATAGHRSKVASTAKPAVIEITDGWYFMKAELDAPLSNYLRAGKLCIGQKLQVCNAVLNSTEGLPPLEGCKTMYLRLHANSTRRAHWALKLGHGRQYFPVALRTAVAGGGMVPLTAIVVSRAYPLVYKERLPNDNGSIDRSVRAEEHASRKFEARKAQLMEAVMQQHQLETAKQAPAQQSKLDSGVAIYEAAITAADQATFMAELTASQQEELSAYMREHEEEQRQLLQNRLQEALEDADLTERNVSPFLRLRVHGLVRNTDLQAEQDNDDDTMLSRGGEAIITVWRPSPEQVEQLQEGRAFWVRSLVASNWNDTHPSSLTGVTPVLHLNTCRQTSWTAVNATALNQFRFWQEPRVATRICELQGIPIGREFDIVGWVLHVGEQTTYGERSQQWLFLADDSCDGGEVDPTAGGEVDLLVVEVNAPVEAFTPLEVSCQGSLLAFSNLVYRCRDSGRGMQNAAVMDVTGITASPKAQHLASAAAHLKQWAAAQHAELLGMRKRVLRALGLNQDVDISADQTDAAALDTPHDPLPIATREIAASIIAINNQEQRSPFTASLHPLKLGAVGDIVIPASSLPKTPTPYLTFEVVLDDGVAVHRVAASVNVMKAIFATLPITMDNIRSALFENQPQVVAQHPPANVMRQCSCNLTVLRLTAPGSTLRRSLADTLIDVLMNGVVFAEEWTSALETAIFKLGDSNCGQSYTSKALLTRVQCLLKAVYKCCLDANDGADKDCIVDCALEDVKAQTEVGTGPIVGPVFLLASTWEAIRQVVLAALAQNHLKVTLHGMPGVGNSPAHWCVAAVEQQALCPLLNDWLESC